MKLIAELVLVFVSISAIVQVQCITPEEELIITSAQKRKLDKFRDRVNHLLRKDYMKEELYLIRWLRARNFNIEKAEEMFKNNLQWRKKMRMDAIEEEDWSFFQNRYKYFAHGVDKKGQPVSYIPLGTWDLRQAALSGEQATLSRYLDMTIQDVCFKPYKLRQAGKNITKVNLVVDLSGFSSTQQGCLPCIPIYVRYVSDVENYFPGCADKVFLVNAPTVFEVVLNAIKPVMGKDLRDSLEVFGPNRNEWTGKLFGRIDRTQLPPDVGGTDDRYDI